uniref:Uncharacterized protein n=1 Tax=Alexandrium catenella TaxID=2925 RepID=A0A7S1S8A8_ALECA
MRSVKPSGQLEPASDDETRYSISCVGTSREDEEQSKALLKKLWLGRGAKEALKVLRNNDISVTNTSDKDEQLGKLERLATDMELFWKPMAAAGWIELGAARVTV